MMEERVYFRFPGDRWIAIEGTEDELEILQKCCWMFGCLGIFTADGMPSTNPDVDLERVKVVQVNHTFMFDVSDVITRDDDDYEKQLPTADQ
jgi:hypothetical protein